MILGSAAAMGVADYTRFSLLILIQTVLIGMARNSLLQPVLIERRLDENADVPLRYLAPLLIGTAVLFAGAYAAAMRPPVLIAAGLGLLSTFPIVQDWLRFRCIGKGKLGAVAWADGIRLVLILGFAFAGGLGMSPEILYSLWCGIYGVSAAFLVFSTDRLREWTRFKDYGDRKSVV